ncbi:MAG: molecular chaperone HtpG [Lachnospiraceae bacterium]|nr:molecular chaperone HtpG [Lachnospiraceae bacterium]
MTERQGNLSINSENMLPIIKKWLYSDHDIFVREVISNACDAISKLHKLEIMGEYQYPDDHKDSIHVVMDPDAKTVSFSDTGLGMTADEVEEYITQIAFSGATAFFEKYKDKANKDDIIGHFGLGFYSVFMVAEDVEIDTLSYREGSQAVHWECDGSSTYTMRDGSRQEPGTTITLHLNEDCLEFANEYRMREVLQRYCSFMPVEIFLEKANAPQEYETIDESELRDTDVVVEHIHEDAKTEEQDDGNGGKKTVEISPARDRVKINKRPVSISDIHPLWAKHPNDCTDEEYKDFYRKVFNDYREPLFWIHLNADYPFNMKGILYFPKINTEYDSIEGTIKLYNNQVFIADNIKEVVPEYMMLLKGVIDCPEFPLNVSRSALQNDGFVKKLRDYISKKVADKLTGMCKTDRENYEKYWDDISPFLKYGCLRDEKFSDRLQDHMLFKDLDGKYFTLKEYLEKLAGKDEEAKKGEAETSEGAESGGANGTDASAEEVKTDDSAAASEDETKGGATDETIDVTEEPSDDAEKKEKEKTTIYYVTDESQQGQYIRMFRENGMDAVILQHNIDSPYMQHIEQKREDIKFQRIDADVTGSMKSEEADEEKLKADTEALSELFKKAIGNDKLTVQVQSLKDENISSMLTIQEEGRRMQDMMRMYSMSGSGMDMDMFAPAQTLTLNENHKLVRYLLDNKDGERAELFAKQLYDLAAIANAPLKAEAMTEFINRSNEIMLLLAQ